jgi:hypothetical protein
MQVGGLVEGDRQPGRGEPERPERGEQVGPRDARAHEMVDVDLDHDAQPGGHPGGVPHHPAQDVGLTALDVDLDERDAGPLLRREQVRQRRGGNLAVGREPAPLHGRALGVVLAAEERDRALLRADGRGDRAHVGGAVAGEVALQCGARGGGRLDGDDSPRRAHGGRGQQRVPAGVGADVHDHVAGPQRGVQPPTQQRLPVAEPVHAARHDQPLVTAKRKP